jgi:hypothetical protein
MEEKQSYEYVMETNKVTPIKYSGIKKVILIKEVLPARL